MKKGKKCQHCNELFYFKRDDAKYCCDSCKVRAWQKRKEQEREKENNGKLIVHPSSVKLLTDATWEFAHSILWNGYPFSKGEINLAKLFIREYYDEIPAEKFTETAHRHFTAYCERILLAKEYVSRFSYRYIPHPCIWLDKENPKGFAGTKRWYLENLAKRTDFHYCENCKENYSLNPVLNHFHFTA